MATFSSLRKVSGYTKGYNFPSLFSIFSALMMLIPYRAFLLLKPIYLLLYNRIRDGYLLVLLGPLVLPTWIIASILLVVACLPSVVLFYICGVCSVFGLVFELPSDFINKNKEDRGEITFMDEPIIPLIMVLSTLAIVITPLCLMAIIVAY